MFSRFEYQDERGVLMKGEGDGTLSLLYQYFLENYPSCEALYMVKWIKTGDYDGTAHYLDDLMYIQIRNQRGYLLLKSQKGAKFVEGHEIRNHPNCKRALFR